MIINKISHDLIDICINYFYNNANNEKIKSNIIDPIIVHIVDKVYPYFIFSMSLVILILILLLSIFFLIIRSLN
tara:strand:+ start:587 stop:808 length:222 start_codon:yes stop_codon:yes gene_type:complete